MKKACSIFSFLFVLSFCHAQKVPKHDKNIYPVDQKYCRSAFHTVYIGKDNTESTLGIYLAEKISNLKTNSTELRLAHKIESPGGIHYTFEQFCKNFRIFRSQVKVNMDKNGNIRSVFDHTFEIHETSDDFSAVENVFQRLPLHAMADHYKKELVYFPSGKELIPALRLEIAKGDSYYEIIYDENGSVIYHRDLALYYSSADSTVAAAVFLPDPLTTASVSYGAPYDDSNNTDVNELNAERKIVSIKVKYDTAASVFRLESPYIKITEHSSPTVPPVTSTTPDFSFTRAQSGFEDVNVFYHISNFHDHMQSLGYNLVNYPLNADVHALNGQDNSNFIAFPSPKLNFGEGGVDDGEDADVIIHEYGHAISSSAAPGTNVGTERNALDEALGDYLASSYSRSINPYQWENVFSWDGHNEFWNGRLSVSNDHYPEDKQNDLYEDADIWSSTMMEIWEDIGRENADALQLEALYGYAAGMDMKDAAQLVIEADSALNNGAFYDQVCMRLYNRGLVDNCITGIPMAANTRRIDVQLLNTENFAAGKGDILIRFYEPAEATVMLIDVSGKLVAEAKLKNSNEYGISGKQLPAGVYLLSIFSEKFTANFKLIRLN